MLTTTNPELENMVWQQENRHRLKRVIEAKIEKNEPDWVLDEYFQPCGSYGCVLGDYLLEEREFIKGDSSLIECAVKFDFKHLLNHFGDRLFEDGVDVFGVSCAGTLQQRLDLLAEIDAEQNAKLAALQMECVV